MKRTDEIRALIEASPHRCAKWIRDRDSGLTLIVSADGQTHAEMARGVHFTDYDKGLLVVDDLTQQPLDDTL